MSDQTFAALRAQFDAGQFGAARQAALEALAQAPDDVELLRYAGRAGVELGSDDAIEQLRRVVELAPDAESWRDLGDALATEGRTDEANDAFRKVLEFDPADELALTNLGHLAFASGNQEEGASLLSQAAETTSRASTAMINLVDMYRSMGKPDEALAQAERVAAAAPDDITALLDVGELSSEVGRLDDAAAAFARLREIDDVPGHEVYPLHGLITVELKREDLGAALKLAEEATALDAHGRSADVVAFLNERLSGPGEEPAPSAAEVDEALRVSLLEYRRINAEGRTLSGGGA